MSSHGSGQQDSQPWSFMTETSTNRQKLQLLTHFDKALRQEGYVIEQLKENALWSKMRCLKCGERLRKWCPPSESMAVVADTDNVAPLSSNKTKIDNEAGVPNVQDAQASRPRRFRCFFHDGRLFKGIWSCCKGKQSSLGCYISVDHTVCSLGDLEKIWHFHHTPSAVLHAPVAGQPTARDRDEVRHDASTNHAPRAITDLIRSAVALDCEMGTAADGSTELIRLTMVDFFTQAILIDSLVYPDVPMLHYNTRYSGVTFSAMKQAVRRRTCIFGRDAARKEVFRFVDSNTVVVVHGGSSDFCTLRWIHPSANIIDTYILEGYDEEVMRRRLKKSLKETVMRRCGVTVQDARLQGGKRAGHDSLEDALATREIVCWWLRHIPDV